MGFYSLIKMEKCNFQKENNWYWNVYKLILGFATLELWTVIPKQVYHTVKHDFTTWKFIDWERTHHIKGVFSDWERTHHVKGIFSDWERTHHVKGYSVIEKEHIMLKGYSVIEKEHIMLKGYSVI